MLKSFKSYWYGSSTAATPLSETSRASSTTDTEVIVTADGSRTLDRDEQLEATRQDDPSSSWSMTMSMDSAMLTSVLKPEEVRQTLSKARTFFGKLGTAAIHKTTQILEENTPILSDFSREQNKFEQEKQHREAIQQQNSVVPWFGYANEESVKKQILALSLDKRNFVRNPPGGSQFIFDMNEFAGAAKLMLAEDSNLSRMRFELVPKAVREDIFWRNYFYRVSLIKQSAQLAELATMKPSSSQARDVTGHSVTGRADGNAAPSEDGTTQLSGSSNTSASFEKLNDASHLSGGELEADADGDDADAEIGDGDFVSDSHSLSQTVTLSHDELAQLNLARAGNTQVATGTTASPTDHASTRRVGKRAEDATSGSDWSPEEFELVAEGPTQSGSALNDSDSIDEELEREILAEIAREESQK